MRPCMEIPKLGGSVSVGEGGGSGSSGSLGSTKNPIENTDKHYLDATRRTSAVTRMHISYGKNL